MTKRKSEKSAYDIAVDLADEIGDAHLVASARQSRDEHKLQASRAKKVFEELTSGLPEKPTDNDGIDYLDYATARLNKTIADNLDANSIHEFLLLCGVRIADLRASIRGFERAEIRHSMPGGSRDKALLIREIWASGKYSDRDLCATQECDALVMSWSTARKALRNTPDPIRNSKKKA
jgi:hypothetical protein